MRQRALAFILWQIFRQFVIPPGSISRPTLLLGIDDTCNSPAGIS